MHVSRREFFNLQLTDNFTDCRYAVFDFKFKSDRGAVGAANMDKIIFIQLCPDNASIKRKMVYASSASAIKSALGSSKLLQMQVRRVTRCSRFTIQSLAGVGRVGNLAQRAVRQADGEVQSQRLGGGEPVYRDDQQCACAFAALIVFCVCFVPLDPIRVMTRHLSQHCSARVQLCE